MPKMKAALFYPAAAAVALLVSEPGFASQAVGRITIYHLNSLIPGRGACIQLSPPLPGDPWACVTHTNLFKELDDMFLACYVNNRRVTVNWTSENSTSHKVIDWAQCQGCSAEWSPIFAR